MLNQLLPTYTQLMADLKTLPADIADLQTSLTEARISQRSAEENMKKRETALLDHAGGMKALGSNDADRKHALAVLLLGDKTYQRLSSDATQHANDAARLANDVADLERRYTALGYQANLLAGLFAALGNASLPAAELPTALPEDVVFMRPIDRNGHAVAPSQADAEAIGL